MSAWPKGQWEGDWLHSERASLPGPALGRPLRQRARRRCSRRSAYNCLMCCLQFLSLAECSMDLFAAWNCTLSTLAMAALLHRWLWAVRGTKNCHRSYCAARRSKLPRETWSIFALRVVVSPWMRVPRPPAPWSPSPALPVGAPWAPPPGLRVPALSFSCPRGPLGPPGVGLGPRPLPGLFPGPASPRAGAPKSLLICAQVIFRTKRSHDGHK